MHASTQHETKKKKEIQAPKASIQQQQQQQQHSKRPLTAFTKDAGQRQKFAATAASSMAEVLQQRGKRQPRSLTWWSEKKKAVVKKYPDGRQEILVPQILTLEQEHYQFPPRSKFLRKLQAAETIEKQRRSSHIAAPEPSITDANKTSGLQQSPTISNGLNKKTMHSTNAPTHDESALNEWFTRHTKKTVSRTDKDRAVADWITEVERSKQLSPPTTSTKRPSLKRATAAKASFSGCGYHNSSSSSCKMQFKSAAGKRWANILNVNETLAPPDEACTIQYIPRKLLMISKKIGLMKNKADKHENSVQYDTSTTVSKIQEIWKEYKKGTVALATGNNDSAFESKVASIAMAVTGHSTSMAAMVHLLLETHNAFKLKSEQKQCCKRTAALEMQLSVERKKRQEAYIKLASLEAAYQQLQQVTTKISNSDKLNTSGSATGKLLSRIAELEAALKQEKIARQKSESRFLQRHTVVKKKLSIPHSSPVTTLRKPLGQNSNSRMTNSERSQTALRQTRTAGQQQAAATPAVTNNGNESRSKPLQKRDRKSTLASIGLAPITNGSSAINRTQIKASTTASKR